MALPASTGSIVVTPTGDSFHLTGHGHFSLEYTVECGQAFRWQWRGTYYEGVVRGRVLRLSQDGERLVVHAAFDEVLLREVIDYFNLLHDTVQIEETLKGRDVHLSAAASRHPGLKIVQQEPWECLISYIVSARNNIPSIRRIVEAMSSRFGTRIDGTSSNTFPSAQALATAPIEDLLECKAAFRTKYIQGTARAVAEGTTDLAAISRMDIVEARRALMELPGVGPKVADCIMLFSMGHYDSFPIDVWIGRAMRHWYFAGEEKSLRELQEYATREFGDLAGYANQHLFFHARGIKLGRRETPHSA